MKNSLKAILLVIFFSSVLFFVIQKKKTMNNKFSKTVSASNPTYTSLSELNKQAIGKIYFNDTLAIINAKGNFKYFKSLVKKKQNIYLFRIWEHSCYSCVDMVFKKITENSSIIPNNFIILYTGDSPNFPFAEIMSYYNLSIPVFYIKSESKLELDSIFQYKPYMAALNSVGSVLNSTAVELNYPKLIQEYFALIIK